MNTEFLWEELETDCPFTSSIQGVSPEELMRYQHNLRGQEYWDYAATIMMFLLAEAGEL